MGWAVGCFPSEGNSIFKMGLWGGIKLYTGREPDAKEDKTESQFQDSSLAKETYKIKCKVS